MTDNTILSASVGTGITLSTDELADSTHVQKIKLMDGTADATGIIAAGSGTAATALRVELPTDGTGQVKIAAGSAVIGEVSIGAATTANADLAKAEDQASASGMVGVGFLSVRKATPANTSGTDGDFEFTTVSNGKLYTTVSGNVAHDSAVGSIDNPVLLGAVAYETDNTVPGTSVAEADISRLKCDLDGRILVNTRHPNGWSASSNLSTAATTVLKAAGGSGLHFYLTSLTISSITAQTTKIVSDSAGSPADEVEIIYTGANGNHTATFPVPIRFPDNVNIAYITTAAVATSVTVTGYTAP